MIWQLTWRTLIENVGEAKEKIKVNAEKRRFAIQSKYKGQVIWLKGTNKRHCLLDLSIHFIAKSSTKWLDICQILWLEQMGNINQVVRKAAKLIPGDQKDN